MNKSKVIRNKHSQRETETREEVIEYNYLGQMVSAYSNHERLDWIGKTFIVPAVEVQVKTSDLASVVLAVATRVRGPPRRRIGMGWGGLGKYSQIIATNFVTTFANCYY